jgi:hypothetical protein
MTLDELERLERAATPGPWTVAENFGTDRPTWYVMNGDSVVAVFNRKEDAAAFAAPRNALPALIECARAALAVRRTPIVDDDFPERLAALDAALARLAEVKP